MVVGTDPWWVWVWVWAQTPMGIPMQGPTHVSSWTPLIAVADSELTYLNNYATFLRWTFDLM